METVQYINVKLTHSGWSVETKEKEVSHTTSKKILLIDDVFGDRTWVEKSKLNIFHSLENNCHVQHLHGYFVINDDMSPVQIIERMKQEIINNIIKNVSDLMILQKQIENE